MNAAYKIYAKLRDIKFLNLDEPQNLVLDCIMEEEKNEHFKIFEGETAKALGIEKGSKKRGAYIAWMEENETMSFSKDDDIEAILIKVYNKRIENYRKIFMQYIDIYISMSKLDLEDLANAYGNLDFLVGNKGIRLNAFKSIYSKLKEYRNKIKAEIYHFNLVKDGKGSFSVCCQKVMDLNNFFFETEIIECNKQKKIMVYQRKFDEMADKLEWFRSKIYYQRKSADTEKIPVFCQVKSGDGIMQEEGAFLYKKQIML